VLNLELLEEKEQEDSLNFDWSGNLGNWNIKRNSVVLNRLITTALNYSVDELPYKVGYPFFTEKLHPDDYQNTKNVMHTHDFDIAK